MTKGMTDTYLKYYKNAQILKIEDGNTIESHNTNRISLSYDSVFSVCPKCKSINIKKNGKRNTKCKDVPFEDKTVEVSIDSQRWKCSNPSCESVFTKRIEWVYYKDNSEKASNMTIRLYDFIIKNIQTGVYSELSKQTGINIRNIQLISEEFFSSRLNQEVSNQIMIFNIVINKINYYCVLNYDKKEMVMVRKDRNFKTFLAEFIEKNRNNPNAKIYIPYDEKLYKVCCKYVPLSMLNIEKESLKTYLANKIYQYYLNKREELRYKYYNKMEHGEIFLEKYKIFTTKPGDEKYLFFMNREWLSKDKEKLLKRLLNNNEPFREAYEIYWLLCNYIDDFGCKSSTLSDEDSLRMEYLTFIPTTRNIIDNILNQKLVSKYKIEKVYDVIKSIENQGINFYRYSVNDKIAFSEANDVVNSFHHLNEKQICYQYKIRFNKRKEPEY